MGKTFGGWDKNVYRENTPKNGPVDRVTLYHYPPGIGFIPQHRDPTFNQKLIMGIACSNFGEDYESGGIYFIDKNKNKFEVEPHIDKGDVLVSYPSLVHGVGRINGKTKQNWDTKKGRWVIYVYTNDSNEMSNRRVSEQVK